MNQRIMLIDDSDVAQEFIRSNLFELGFGDIVSFLDPREALETIQAGETAADLILLDIMMPAIDGIELCARIRGLEGWRDVPIIMLTSRKDMGALSRAFIAGANDFVTKPFNRIELQARMRSCLRLSAELGRRRESESKTETLDMASQTIWGAPQNMLGTKSSFQSDLRALSAEAQSSVGLITLKIDNLKTEADFSISQASQIIQDVAQTLSQVSISAGHSFAHWEDDLFCFAGVGASEETMRAQAEKFAQAIKSANLTIERAWGKVPVSISAAICLAGEAGAGHRLAQTIKFLDTDTSDTQHGMVNVVHV